MLEVLVGRSLIISVHFPGVDGCFSMISSKFEKHSTVASGDTAGRLKVLFPA